MNVMATTETGDTLLVKSIPTGTEAHTAEYVAGELKKVIEDVGPEKVQAVITDNASNMVKMWKLLVNMYPWMRGFGCLAHCLNLLAKDVCKFLKPLFASTKKLLNFFDRSVPGEVLIETRRSNNVTRGLARHCKTRWGSHGGELLSILENKVPMRQAIVRNEIMGNRTLAKDAEPVEKLMSSPIFWDKVK